MLTRIARQGYKGQARNFYWSSKSSSVKTVERVPEGEATDILSKIKKDHDKNRQILRDIENVAVVEYKKFPALAHWNKDSPDYVPAERDEEEIKRENDAFNYTIDNLKNSLKLQEEIYQKIEQLDRPYLRGTPGTTTNVFRGELKDYSEPTGHNFRSFEQDHNEMLKQDANKHRFARDVVFTPKHSVDTSNLRQWQQEVENRPVNDHFHHDKGFKYDVTTPYEQRYPHVADRLGYPEFLGDNFDRLFRLEDEKVHPNYLDQPFVQTPPINPSSELNFAEGEVIYENKNVIEWSKLTQLVGSGSAFFICMWKPFHQVFTNIPGPSTFEEFPIPFFEMNPYNIDNYGLGIFAIPILLYSIMRFVAVRP